MTLLMHSALFLVINKVISKQSDSEGVRREMLCLYSFYSTVQSTYYRTVNSNTFIQNIKSISKNNLLKRFHLTSRLRQA